VKKMLPSLPESPADEKLEKRALKLLRQDEPNDIASYIMGKFTTGAVKLLQFDDSKNDLSTSAFVPMNSRVQSYNLGVKGLCGCTLLVLVSSKGLYMAHL
jgi:hypothetical protein